MSKKPAHEVMRSKQRPDQQETTLTYPAKPLAGIPSSRVVTASNLTRAVVQIIRSAGPVGGAAGNSAEVIRMPGLRAARRTPGSARSRHGLHHPAQRPPQLDRFLSHRHQRRHRPAPLGRHQSLDPAAATRSISSRLRGLSALTAIVSTSSVGKSTVRRLLDRSM
jgi:hypothetical protein